MNREIMKNSNPAPGEVSPLHLQTLLDMHALILDLRISGAWFLADQFERILKDAVAEVRNGKRA